MRDEDVDPIRIPWFLDTPIREDVWLEVGSNQVTHWCIMRIDGRDGFGPGSSYTGFGGPDQMLQAEAHLRNSIEVYGGYTMREAIG